MVKNNPNRFAYIGCLYNSLDRASDELSVALYDESVCEILSEEDINALDKAHSNIENVLRNVQSRIKEFGIHADDRIDLAMKKIGSGLNDE